MLSLCVSKSMWLDLKVLVNIEALSYSFIRQLFRELSPRQ